MLLRAVSVPTCNLLGFYSCTVSLMKTLWNLCALRPDRWAHGQPDGYFCCGMQWGDGWGLGADLTTGFVLRGHPFSPLHRNGTHSMGQPCGCPAFPFHSVFACSSVLETGTGQPQLQVLEFAQQHCQFHDNWSCSWCLIYCSHESNLSSLIRVGTSSVIV